MQRMITTITAKTYSNPTLLVIAGPTAVGKTDFTISTAQHYGADIISCDSRQFYREMKIGTAYPTDEQLAAAPHHFIGNLSIHDYYSVSKFEQEVLELLPGLFKKSHLVIMTGGSGLYIDAVCNGIDTLPDPEPEVRQFVFDLFDKEGIEGLRYQLRIRDPQFMEQVDQANYKRLMRALEVCIQMKAPYSQFLTKTVRKRDFQIEKVFLNRDREVLYNRINQRVDMMLEEGLLIEAQSLHPFKNLNSLNTVGYRELFEHFEGKCTLEDAVEKIKTNTRRYAKRQLTWIKRDGNYAEIVI